LTVLWPEAGRIRPAQDANNYSLVSLLNLKGTTILESADLPGAYDTYAAEPARILKAPHHGSPTSSTGDFLRQVDPEVVLLTCRREQRADDYQQALSGAGIVPRLFATARSGAVFIRFTDSGFEAAPFLPDRGRQGSIDSDGGMTP
jgi:competence protein ComEC